MRTLHAVEASLGHRSTRRKPITATGPGGHKIRLSRGAWVDNDTGSPIAWAVNGAGHKITVEDGAWVDPGTGKPVG